MGQGIGDCEALMGKNRARIISKVLPEGVAMRVIPSRDEKLVGANQAT